MSARPLLHHFFPGRLVVDALQEVPLRGPCQTDRPCCAVVVSHQAGPARAQLAATGPRGLRRGWQAGPPVIARARIHGARDDCEASLVQITGPLAGTQTDDFLANLERVQGIRAETWLELQVVLMPGRSDADRLVDLVTAALQERLGADVPVHLTGGGPGDGPGGANVTLQQARWIAMSNGLRWVYTDDLADPSARRTWCPGCDALLIDHQGVRSQVVGLSDGRCIHCGWVVAGRFQCEAAAA